MRAIRFHELGDPETVLHLEDATEPHAGPGRVRVRVHACGLNPADWALCGGLFFEGGFPKGIGLEVSGVVDEVGDGVTGVKVGDVVLGPAPFRGPTAGAADLAVLETWTAVPDGLDLLQAASLPMAAETATRALDGLGVRPGERLLVGGAGTVIGGAAVQLALHRGIRVLATAGPSSAPALRDRGVPVTAYGEGVVERVAALADGPVDRVLDAGPVGGGLRDLVRIAGDPDRVITVGADVPLARELGARVALGGEDRNDVLPEAARLAADGALSVPIAGTYPMERFLEAVIRSRTNRAGGKLLLLVSDEALAAA